MSNETWRELILELFSGEMRDEWGWGKTLRPARGTTTRDAAEGGCASIDTDGLDIPYFCGRVTVDFEALTVKCHAFDQKTPADRYWEMEPEEQWWARARSCAWPFVAA